MWYICLSTTTRVSTVLATFNWCKNLYLYAARLSRLWESSSNSKSLLSGRERFSIRWISLSSFSSIFSNSSSSLSISLSSSSVARSFSMTISCFAAIRNAIILHCYIPNKCLLIETCQWRVSIADSCTFHLNLTCHIFGNLMSLLMYVFLLSEKTTISRYKMFTRAILRIPFHANMF